MIAKNRPIHTCQFCDINPTKNFVPLPQILSSSSKMACFLQQCIQRVKISYEDFQQYIAQQCKDTRMNSFEECLSYIKTTIHQNSASKYHQQMISKGIEGMEDIKKKIIQKQSQTVLSYYAECEIEALTNKLKLCEECIEHQRKSQSDNQNKNKYLLALIEKLENLIREQLIKHKIEKAKKRFSVIFQFNLSSMRKIDELQKKCQEIIGSKINVLVSPQLIEKEKNAQIIALSQQFQKQSNLNDKQSQNTIQQESSITVKLDNTEH